MGRLRRAARLHDVVPLRRDQGVQEARPQLSDEAARVAETRAFFGPPAAGWDARFAEDGPAFERAVADLAPTPGGTVVDLGCGTGRAGPALAAAVGPTGRVVALDVTPEMLAVAQAAGLPRLLVLADAGRLPFAARAVDAVLAAGLLTHLADPAAALRDLARVVRPGGRLGVFHPVGRAALAARHGHALRPDDLLDRRVLPSVLAGAGWDLDVLDDGPDRYFARASAR